MAQPVLQHVADRSLKTGAQIGEVAARQRRIGLRHLPNRGLQAGKREIATGGALERPRQIEVLSVAVPGATLDARAAGIGKAEQLGGLVEGFAERIIDRRAESCL
jgi:hypothetical protein